MAIYTVEAPDGKLLEIEGPEGADPQMVLQQAQQLYKPGTSRSKYPVGQFGASKEVGGITDKLLGAGEAALSVGSGLLSSVPAGITGLGAFVKSGGESGSNGASYGQSVAAGLEGAADVIKDIQQRLTYVPRSPEGQRYTQNVGEALNFFPELAGNAVIRATANTGLSDEARAAAATATGIVADPLNLLGFKGGRAALAAPITAPKAIVQGAAAGLSNTPTYLLDIDPRRVDQMLEQGLITEKTAKAIAKTNNSVAKEGRWGAAAVEKNVRSVREAISKNPAQLLNVLAAAKSGAGVFPVIADAARLSDIPKVSQVAGTNNNVYNIAQPKAGPLPQPRQEPSIGGLPPEPVQPGTGLGGVFVPEYRVTVDNAFAPYDDLGSTAAIEQATRDLAQQIVKDSQNTGFPLDIRTAFEQAREALAPEIQRVSGEAFQRNVRNLQREPTRPTYGAAFDEGRLSERLVPREPTLGNVRGDKINANDKYYSLIDEYFSKVQGIPTSRVSPGGYTLKPPDYIAPELQRAVIDARAEELMANAKLTGTIRIPRDVALSKANSDYRNFLREQFSQYPGIADQVNYGLPKQPKQPEPAAPAAPAAPASYAPATSYANETIVDVPTYNAAPPDAPKLTYNPNTALSPEEQLVGEIYQRVKDSGTLTGELTDTAVVNALTDTFLDQAKVLEVPGFTRALAKEKAERVIKQYKVKTDPARDPQRRVEQREKSEKDKQDFLASPSYRQGEQMYRFVENYIKKFLAANPGPLAQQLATEIRQNSVKLFNPDRSLDQTLLNRYDGDLVEIFQKEVLDDLYSRRISPTKPFTGTANQEVSTLDPETYTREQERLARRTDESLANLKAQLQQRQQQSTPVAPEILPESTVVPEPQAAVAPDVVPQPRRSGIYGQETDLSGLLQRARQSYQEPKESPDSLIEQTRQRTQQKLGEEAMAQQYDNVLDEYARGMHQDVGSPYEFSSRPVDPRGFDPITNSMAQKLLDRGIDSIPEIPGMTDTTIIRKIYNKLPDKPAPKQPKKSRRKPMTAEELARAMRGDDGPPAVPSEPVAPKNVDEPTVAQKDDMVARMSARTDEQGTTTWPPGRNDFLKSQSRDGEDVEYYPGRNDFLKSQSRDGDVEYYPGRPDKLLSDKIEDSDTVVDDAGNFRRIVVNRRKEYDVGRPDFLSAEYSNGGREYYPGRPDFVSGDLSGITMYHEGRPDKLNIEYPDGSKEYYSGRPDNLKTENPDGTKEYYQDQDQ